MKLHNRWFCLCGCFMMIVLCCGFWDSTDTPVRAAQPEMLLQLANYGQLESLSFSSDGRTLASHGDDGLKLWSVKSLGLKYQLAIAHSHDPRQLKFTGFIESRLSFKSRNEPIEIRDARSGQLIKPLTGAVLSYDNTQLTYSKNGIIKVLDARTGRLISSFATDSLKDKSGRSLWISRSGHLAAEELEDGRVKLWRVVEGTAPQLQLLHVLENDRGALGSTTRVTGPILFSPDEQWVMTSGNNPQSTGFNMPTGPDEYNGEYIVQGGGYALKLWSVRTGKLRHILSTFGDTQRPDITAAFTPDGKSLIAAYEQFAGVWDVHSGKLWRSISGYDNSSDPFPIDGPYAISPDGRILASSSRAGSQNDNKRIQLWNLETGKRLRASLPGPADILSLALSTDGKQLAVGDSSNQVRLWDMQLARMRLSFPFFNPTFMGFLPEGAFWSGNSAEAFIWDARTGQLRHKLRNPNYKTSPFEYSDAVLVSPDGKTFMTKVFNGGALHIWEVGTNRLLHVIPETESSLWDVRRISSTRDGRLFLSTQIYKKPLTISLWNRETGTLERTYTIPKEPAEGAEFWETWHEARFWEDGKSFFTLESTRSERRTRLWDVATGQSEILDDAFGSPLTTSPDGRLWAFLKGDDIQVHDGKTRRLLKSIPFTKGGLSEAQFSPDGRYLIVSSQGAVHIFSINQARLLVTLQALPKYKVSSHPATSWIAYTPTGYYNASPGAEKFIRWRVGDQLFPVAKYSKQFHRPNLVQKALRGG
jgi:WD40 repeat protein